MNPETLTDLGAWLCGQSRCLVVDGLPLPLCQRCLGLYLGGGITVLWLLGSGVWRRGLPSFRVGLLQSLALIVAMVGGLHLLDTGPRWRLVCGLWTGHVALVWLVSAATHLHRRRAGTHPPGWRPRDRIQGVLALPFLGLVALLLPWTARGSWLLWSCAALSCAGLTLLGTVVTLLWLLALAARPGALRRNAGLQGAAPPGPAPGTGRRA